MEKLQGLEQALAAFDFGGEVVGAARYGEGHINDTFAVYIQQADGEPMRFILQKLNTQIFKHPQEVMANIVGVTQYLKKIIEKNGGDPLRETMTVVLTKTKDNCFLDSHGGVWRAFVFIEDTICLQKVEKPEHFYSSAKSFGNFMRLLENYPADTLFESIPLFHDTENRFKNLEEAIKKNKAGRKDSVQPEIDFALAHQKDCSFLTDKLKKGELPLRVTHNDTKLNNILMDEKSGEGICVIDLDTIMPGLALNDYGDSIRFGASTASEDEKDLDKVHFSLELFEIYTKGYLEAAGMALTKEEKSCLVWGAKLMTLECGMRFLTDHLNGDTYFKTHRDGQNLDRCRTQFKLVSEMEENWDKMQKIVEKYSK
ncbi:MAG: aminoglycoside phosphotransferase family protein [Oscillospiraceae bacterium]